MKTITFYSYKGGTGRSLLVANTARFLAQAGQHVVILDLDLEAPGLHTKFHKVLPGRLRTGIPIRREDLAGDEIGPGSVDLLLSWQTRRPVSVEQLLYDVTPNDAKGRIELLPAGPAPSPYYNNLLMDLNWNELWRDTQYLWGRVMQFKHSLHTRGAAFLLVDARTGVTDVGRLALTGLIDKAQEPGNEGGRGTDKTVCMFTTTPESVQGIAMFMRGLASTHGQPSVIPTLTRVPQDSAGNPAFLRDICQRLREPARDGSGLNSTFRVEPHELQVIRSDPLLQVAETILVDDETRSVRDSMIVLDYLSLFKRLELPTDILPAESLEIIELYRDRSIATDAVSELKRTSTLSDARERGLSYRAPTDIAAPKFQYFSSRILDHLCTLATVSPASTQPQFGDIGFDVLALRMRDAMLHFVGDPFYLTPARQEVVDLLPLGRVTMYGFAIQASQDVPFLESIDGLQSRNGLDFEQDLLPILIRHLQDGDVIGLLGETAATSEVYGQLMANFSSRQIFLAPTRHSLWGWMQARNRFVVIADIDLIAGFKTLNIRRLKYRRGHLAGFMCPLGDAEWKRALGVAVAATLEEDSKLDWESIVRELEKAGIQAFTREEVLRELLLDMTHKQAIEWRRRLETFATS